LQIFREEKVIHKIKKFIFKEPETLVIECQYCGNTYSKTLDKCPHCGASKKKLELREKRKKRRNKP